MLRIAICDSDEKSCYNARDCIGNVLDEAGTEYKIEIFFDSAKLFQAMHDRLFNIIVCDRYVGNEDMVSFIGRIREERYPLNVIFVSDSADDASEIHEFLTVFPLTCIKKPLDKASVERVVEFVSSFRGGDKRFYVSAKNGEKYMIDENEIRYIEVFRNDICIHLAERDVVCRYTLTGFLKKLSGQFVRCHQSYAVNILHAVGIRRYVIELEDGKSVPVSKKNYGYARDRISGSRRYLLQR